jgi:hypothetical protein
MLVHPYSLATHNFATPGDWRPPSPFSAAVWLVISTCIAVRLTLDFLRSGDFNSAFTSASVTVASAKHLVFLLCR